MPSLRILSAFVLFSVTICANAQSFTCSTPATPGYIGLAFLEFRPSAPQSMQPVAITVGRVAYTANSLTSQIQGSVINVTLTGSFIPFDPPPPTQCLRTTVGPLTAGVYTVNAYLLDVFLPSAPPSLIATTSLVVLGTDSAIPTLGMSGLAVLILLVTIATRHATRTRT